VAGAPLHVFTPRVATRGVDQAVVQYYLAHPADTVTIEILDEAGKVVRTFAGSGAPRPAAANTGANAPRDTILSPAGCDASRSRGGPSAPSARAGLNRFVWDLRYPGATTFDCMIIWSASPQNGPLAVPGRYQVRVTANGQTVTQPLTVRMDPRLKGVTLAALREQFDLAMKIRDRVSAANEAVIRIRQLRSGIADRVGKSGTPEVAQAGDSAARKLLAVEENLYQVRNRSGQDPLNFPIKLNNRIASLGRSVQTGDARPTAAAHVVFRELSAELDVELERLDQVIATEVAAFNRVLTERGVEPVVVGGR
jgi:hypothetical protein